MALKGENHPCWKGDAASIFAKRRRAVRMYALGNCEVCGCKATERHHKDGNTGNNVRDNILIVCRSCHMKIDGRLARFIATTVPVKPAEECSNCRELAKPLRKGLCHKCNEYQRRNGSPRPNFAPGFNSVTAENYKHIIDLSRKNLSHRKISAITGVSACTVRNVISSNTRNETVTGKTETHRTGEF